MNRKLEKPKAKVYPKKFIPPKKKKIVNPLEIMLT